MYYAACFIYAGYRFPWLLQPGFFLKTKKYFYNQENPMFSSFFNKTGTMYGAYLSTDYKNSRLKLDIKPLISRNIKTQVEQNFINFAFNFHFDIILGIPDQLVCILYYTIFMTHFRADKFICVVLILFRHYSRA